MPLEFLVGFGELRLSKLLEPGEPAGGLPVLGGGGALGSLCWGCVARLLEFGSFLALVDPADNRGQQAKHEVEQQLHVDCRQLPERVLRQAGVQQFCEAVGQGVLRLWFTGVGRLVGAGDLAAHVGVGCEVLHAVIVHDTKVSAAEGFCHGQRNLRLGLDDLGLHLRHAGGHFLLLRDSGSPADFCLRLRNQFVGLGLFGLQLGSDVFADIDIRDVD